jgi:SAM-dependent methyltransferase
MPSVPLSQNQIDQKLRNENLGEWQELWWASQGGETRNRRLELIAAALPFSKNDGLSVLDMCSGPGDLARFIRLRFPKARVDCVDRDPFLLSLCLALNRRRGISNVTFVRDLWDTNWCDGLSREYDAVVAATALHWFDVQRLGELFVDVFRLLRPGGVFLFAEPASAPPLFASVFEDWKARQPDLYDPSAWDRFWSRVNTLLGYDHRNFRGGRPPGRGEIGDRGIPVLEYVALLKNAGFESIDVLLRDSEKVVLASSKPKTEIAKLDDSH